jgi:RNA polymerase sigma-70 factor (ECF subfamily)
VSTLETPHPPDGTPPSDAVLLAGVARHDRLAFEQLYRRFYPRLFGYLLRLVRRPELAEEALDDAMVVVWQKAAEFRGSSRVSTWIFGIAYRKGLKALERSERGETDLERAPAGEPVDEGGPERDLRRRELAMQIDAALGRLPVEQRAVVELTFIHQLPYREIAELLGCPVNTVKTRMFHARRRLRRLLPGLGGARRQAGETT